MQRAAWGRAGTLLQGGRSRAGTGAGAAPGGMRNTSASSREGGISEEKEEEEQHYLRAERGGSSGSSEGIADGEGQVLQSSSLYILYRMATENHLSPFYRKI